MSLGASFQPQTAPYRRVRPTGKQRLEAARKLLGPGRQDRESAQRLLESAERHGISLSHLWATVTPDGGAVRQACLAVVGSGRSAMVFTSHPAGRAEEQELAELVRAVCGSLEGVHLAQSLLEIEERAPKAALVEAGFFGVGTLAYLQRATPTDAERFPLESAWPEGVRVRRYQSGDDAALLRGLERSYEGTLDCPELCGLRSTADVLESHRAAGRWDPAHWWLVEHADGIGGMLLLNPSPEMHSIELVYLGLVPELRRKGLGGALLRHGLARLRGRPEPLVTCAVDERNEPALRAYRVAGFTAFARRVALVRPCDQAGPSRRSAG